MPPSPTLTLHHLLPSEAPSFVRIRISALAPTINKLVFQPDGPYSATITDIENRVRDWVGQKCPLLVVKDESLGGEIIAAAKWRLVGGSGKGIKIRGLTEEELDEELGTIPTPWLESDVELWNGLYGYLMGTTREVMGRKAYWTLDLLMTETVHRRRGAATLLVQWGCDRADEMGIEAYVEASLEGTPMYEKCGFRTVKTFVYDPAKDLGKDVGYVYECNAMVRPAKGM
ncbi:hypothetical protein P154DRAFT_449407 [Amniculicola lignicola CBS 123094]|uniref:N-acetyltransferase domain-containing protein n=1 Tax=Amniculicola lignicola CBS 123094 TaxID=1392246 RepID=A0A6A5VYH7_9PLEO|nr:hypothetical protein P154DRAFT_449407 [Amniculicola lignicola CBS 123094]